MLKVGELYQVLSGREGHPIWENAVFHDNRKVSELNEGDFFILLNPACGVADNHCEVLVSKDGKRGFIFLFEWGIRQGFFAKVETKEQTC